MHGANSVYSYLCERVGENIPIITKGKTLDSAHGSIKPGREREGRMEWKKEEEHNEDRKRQNTRGTGWAGKGKRG